MMKKLLVLSGVVLVSLCAQAVDNNLVEQLKKLGAQKVEIQPSPVNGFKTAITDQGVLYISEDGKYILQGRLFETAKNRLVDHTSQVLNNKLEALKHEMIVYPAKNEKYVVTVFTDISCPYCNKLHEQMAEYNELGITIRYLAFPRAGMNSQTARQMEAIFTAKDPVFAFNESEKGNLPKQLKTPKMVEQHYELGVQYGIRGTPSIITQTGELIGGYLPPRQLLEALSE